MSLPVRFVASRRLVNERNEDVQITMKPATTPGDWVEISFTGPETEAGLILSWREVQELNILMHKYLTKVGT